MRALFFQSEELRPHYKRVYDEADEADEAEEAEEANDKQRTGISSSNSNCFFAHERSCSPEPSEVLILDL